MAEKEGRSFLVMEVSECAWNDETIPEAARLCSVIEC